MPRSCRSRSTLAAERVNLYDEITARIIGELEAGRLPWVQPWGASGVAAPLAMPRNATTGRGYSGINVLILWGAVIARGYSCQSWLTFRQALGLGGNVRKGERGTTVVFADRFVPDDEKRRSRETGEDAQAIPFLKRFTVFSTDQCEGLPDDLATTPLPVSEGLIQPHVETLIRASGADLPLGGDKAFYAPGLDYIQVPDPRRISSRSIGIARRCTNSVIGRATPAGSAATCRAASVRQNTPAKNWSQNSALPSPARRWASPRPSGTPTIWVRGSRCCARTIAQSSAPRRPRPRPPTICSPSGPAPSRPRPTMRGRRRNGSPRAISAVGAAARPQPRRRRPVDDARPDGGARRGRAHARLRRVRRPDWEPTAVYDHLAWLRSPNVLPFPVHVVSGGDIHADLLRAATGARWASIPAFTRTVRGVRVEIGMIRRQCTKDYKIASIRRTVRALAGLTRRRSPAAPVVEQWIGISFDESVRMKPSFEA